jgi:hypothetical protein
MPKAKFGSDFQIFSGKANFEQGIDLINNIKLFLV